MTELNPTKVFINDLYKNNTLEKREIDLILCHVLMVNTAGLFIFDKDISKSQQQHIHDLLQQRNNGKPLAYITGSKEFWTLDLKVNQHTLIPRPETEQIVELVLQWTNNNFTGKLLDLGTGTGAIALSIAQERPQIQITAIDSSPECIKVAQYNQQKYSLANVDIFQSDWFKNIINQKFDYIVSNPPYIAENDQHMSTLTYEPSSALTAKNNGLADLAYIIAHSQPYLRDNGRILLEHGHDQSHEVQRYLADHFYTHIHTHKDLAGIPRITTAQLSSST
ncbi:MAG: peptide chain release factor N(5)-glutamine methyltransferase [Alcanivoracaceae bacterium]|nr:peptide chain release factor N(5)-glutamine methyltransferase [Alcanivoracaceae bacterium]